LNRNTTPEATTSLTHHWQLALWCGCHGLVFTWAGLELPVTRHTPLPMVMTALALTHFATGVASLSGTRLLERLSAALAWLSTVDGLWLLGSIGATAWQMLRDFGALGRGLAVALGAIAVLAVASTLPFPLWWLRRRRRLQRRA